MVYDPRTTAVVTIDMQEIFRDWEPPIHDLDGTNTRIATLLAKARKAGAKVIYVQHFIHDHPEVPFMADVVPFSKDIIIKKSTYDGFLETTLEAELKTSGITHVLVVGYKSELCVDTIVRRAKGLGFDVSLVSDCHSTSKNPVIDAETVIRYTNFVLESFATIISLEEIAFAF